MTQKFEIEIKSPYREDKTVWTEEDIRIILEENYFVISVKELK